MIVVFSIASHLSNAQSDPTMDPNMVMNWVTGADVDAIPNWNQPLQGLVGTPFLKSEWSRGTLLLASGNEMEVDLKYDIYRDQVRVRRVTGDSLIVQPGLIREFAFENMLVDQLRFIYLLNVKQVDRNSDIGYFQQVWKGENYSLLAKWVKEMRMAERPSAYSSGRNYNELVNKPKRYYVLRDNVLMKVKPKKSDILKLFPEHKKEIADYLSGTKGKIDERRMKAIVELIDS